MVALLNFRQFSLARILTTQVFFQTPIHNQRTMEDNHTPTHRAPDEKGKATLKDLFTPGLFRKREGTFYSRPLSKPSDNCSRHHEGDENNAAK
jgi:hypothetical protein